MLAGLLNACTSRSFSASVASNSEGCIKCVSLTKRPCQFRPTLVNITSNETRFLYIYYLCSGICETTDDPYA